MSESAPRCPHCGMNLPTAYEVEVKETTSRTYIVPAATQAEAISSIRSVMPPGSDWFKGLMPASDDRFELVDEKLVRRGGYFVRGLA